MQEEGTDFGGSFFSNAFTNVLSQSQQFSQKSLEYCYLTARHHPASKRKLKLSSSEILRENSQKWNICCYRDLHLLTFDKIALSLAEHDAEALKNHDNLE